MDNEQEQEEVVEDLTVGVMPANTQLLSNLSETSKEISENLSYLMGGVECYRDINQRSQFPFDISLEDASVNIKAIIERILTYLADLTKDLFDGSLAGSLAVEAVRNRAERVLLDSRTSRRNGSKRDFRIETRIANLCVNYKVVSDPQQLLIQLKTFNATAKAIYNYLTYSVYACFDQLIQFDPTIDNIDELGQTLLNMAPSVLGQDPRFSNKGFSIKSSQLLGCQQIVINNKRPDSAPLEQILGCSMALQPAESEPKPLPDSIKYDKFSLSLEQSLLREVLQIAETLASYNTVNRRAIRRNRLQLVNQRLANLSKIMDSEQNQDVITTCRYYIRVLETYSGWVSSPYIGLMALAQRNLTAVLNVCEGNAK